MRQQILGFIILCSVLFGCKRTEPEVIVRVIERVVYRDTCDSEFIRKIGEIETGNNDDMSGENDMGRGRFGTYEICVRGSGLMDALGYTHEDMHDPKKSKHVFWAMMGIFTYQYWSKYGQPPTYEDLARMWAGGPNGYQKESTLRYLDKFRSL